uniref:Uncharacterized protein n=1 Tax=uncultured marine virus TaxID=186617 RepID=A0A0F7L641_9VIRU|nr:hypothetical protein [uncultured marine virus]
MQYKHAFQLLSILNSTGKFITVNGQETLEPRALKTRAESNIRQSMSDKINKTFEKQITAEQTLAAESKSGKPDLLSINKKLSLLMKEEEELTFDKEEEALLKECMDSYKGITPDLDQVFLLYGGEKNGTASTTQSTK